MSKEEFIEYLERMGYPYNVKGPLVSVRGGIIKMGIEEIYENVCFENLSWVRLNELKSLPDTVRFENRGNVWISGVTELVGNYRFDCFGNVILSSVNRIDGTLEFYNEGGQVWIEQLREIKGDLIFGDEIKEVYCYSFNDFEWARIPGVSLGRSINVSLSKIIG